MKQLHHRSLSTLLAAMASFARLATVEVQLIMHCCDLRALVALARSSKELHAAACSNFATQCLPLLWKDVLAYDCALLDATPLSRHCRVGVRVARNNLGKSDVECAGHLLDMLERDKRLRGIDLTCWDLGGSALRKLLTGPVTQQQLTHLHIGLLASMEEDMGLLHALHHLRSFRCNIFLCHETASFPPQLTALHLNDLNGHAGHFNAAVALRECTQLREVTLSAVCETLVVAVLTHPNLQSLRSLTISSLLPSLRLHGDRPKSKAPTSDEWIAIFSNLQQLEHLSLSRCVDVDRPLQAVSMHSRVAPYARCTSAWV